MKHSILIFVALLVTGLSYGQGEIDAFNYSSTDITGTARGMGMAGAFGALGGDVTGIVSNPAGIAVYRSSELVTTLNFSNMSSSTDLTGNKFKENKFKFNFDNIAYVGAFETQNEAIPFFNFGFSFNRLKNFERNYKMRGTGMGSSLTDYIGVYTTAVNVDERNLGVTPGNYRDVYETEPWLSVMGYNGYLIDPAPYNKYNLENAYDGIYSGIMLDNGLDVSERGYIDTYDFTFGTNIGNILSLGLTFAITSMNYQMASTYTEDFHTDGNYGYDFNNWLETEGTGYNLKVGAIFTPINALRIGVAYHSPTWYLMNDYYSSSVAHDLYALNTNVASNPDNKPIDPGYAVRSSIYKPNVFYSNEGYEATTEYTLNTPYKWIFSIAGVIGQQAIVSLDYEITNYKSMKLGVDNNAPYIDFSPDNSFIKEDYKASSTLKAGMEYRFTPKVSARLGYAWVQSPLEKGFKDGNVEVATSGTVTHYTLPGDANYFTVGLGYRFPPSTKDRRQYFYIDAAFVYKEQKADLYPFSKIAFAYEGSSYDKIIDSTPAKMKNTLMKGLLTVGYRF